MNYIGSKKTLLPFLEASIESIIDKKSRVFCDLFAGTGAVGAHFKKKGYEIVANDLQYYSFVLNNHYIKNIGHLSFRGLESTVSALVPASIADRGAVVCQYLNELAPVHGFIFKNYTQAGTAKSDHKRLYFSDDNGGRADAIRDTIEKWKERKMVTEGEYFFLLTSLLESIDERANTAAVYGAFLKKLKAKAGEPLVLKPARTVEGPSRNHRVFNEDINSLVKTIEADVVYLDPPYNQRQYATNYHILETIARNDNPSLHGKTGLRDYAKQKSEYCSRLKVKDSFRDLVSKLKTRYIFLSYNNEGLLRPEDIKEIMQARGEYGCFSQRYGRFVADRNRSYSASETEEFLHYVVCTTPSTQHVYPDLFEQAPQRKMSVLRATS